MSTGAAERIGKLTTLKTRPDFQRVRGGGRCEKPGFVLEGKRRTLPPSDVDASKPDLADHGNLAAPVGPRFGFTITKKIGNAVVRNRVRRRIKAALAELAAGHLRPDMDYVVVARSKASDQDFTRLKGDIADALKQVNARADAKKSATKTSGPRQSTASPASFHDEGSRGAESQKETPSTSTVGPRKGARKSQV